MISPDQDLQEFPPWVWPYIRVADLAQSKAFAKLRVSGELGFEKLPALAADAHLMLISQTIALKNIATQLGGETGKGLATAADRSMAEYIDDFCGTPPGHHPPVPHIQEFAAKLAVLAASFGSDKLGKDFAHAAQQVNDRAQRLGK
jgi:hypothetical protein